MIYFVAIIKDNQNVFVEPYLLFQSLYYLESDSVVKSYHKDEDVGGTLKKGRKNKQTKKPHKSLGSLWWVNSAELRCSARNSNNVHCPLIEKYRCNIPKHSGHNTTENEYVLRKKRDFYI